MTQTQRGVVIGLGAAVVVALVVFGIAAIVDGNGSGRARSSSVDNSGSATNTAGPTGAAATNGPTTVTTPPGPSRCHTSQLALHEEQAEGAAGTSYTTYSLTNASTSSCTLTGYPGIGFVAADGSTVAASVARDPTIPTGSKSGPPAPVALRKGDRAVFVVATPNFDSRGVCPPAAKVIVTPPDETDSLSVPTTIAVCPSARVRVSPIR